MACVGYHASHEQFAPSELLALAKRAESAGFEAAMCSDHFHPWSRAQGQSGYAWSWLGAAMAVTELPFGVVTAPVGRYHPAVVAQKVATLAEMYPGRFWIAAGSGEALNEAITADPWPPKPQRNKRLLEAVQVMRALWTGEEVDHDGSFAVRHAKLYTRPRSSPPVLLAALTEDTARWGASWADGLITVSAPHDKLKRLVAAFREGGGDGKPLYLQVKLSYAPTEADARRGAYEQWRTNVLSAEASENLTSPRQYEAAAANVDPSQVLEAVNTSADTQRHLAWLQEYVALGFEHLYLHNVNKAQAAFIDDFGAEVLPGMR